ncbi:MAG: DUF1540 domain-containing protein [Oscillospiraceae bacterium]
MSNIKESEDCICGVVCEVETCQHNNCHSGCTATSIKVGEHNATCQNETACQSFKKTNE